MSHSSPTPVSGTSAEARADARSRAVRTVAQGLISVVLVAVAGVITDQVVVGQSITWPALAAAAGTAALTAVAAYVQRRLEGHRG
ncbi:hypothetical protein GCM10027294_43910 [Marinactinospora endophytica]